MEYVIVKYYRYRKVYLRGEHFGFTNRKLRVDRGTQSFDLGEPVNYTPSERRPFVKNTTPNKPMVITFEPMES